MTPGNGSPGSPPGGPPPPPPPGGPPPNWGGDWRDWKHQQRMQKMQWRMQRAEWRRQHPGPGPIIPGLVLLIIGALFLLRNLGFVGIDELWQYWPSVLIVIGILHAIFPRHGTRSLIGSGLLIVMGGLLQAQSLGYIRGNVWEVIWPVMLIFLGLSFLFRGRAGFSGCAGAPPWGGWGPTRGTANRLNESTVFGGIKQRNDSQEFEGGYLSSTFGGIELDLRGANTKLDELTIQADAVFGGIDLFLPSHWNVTVRGSGVFGGFEDQTHPPATTGNGKNPHVTVVGSAVFGGVTVRN